MTNPTSIYTFGAGTTAAAGAIIAEIDGMMHLDAEGNERSSFLPGEDVYFIIHYDPAKVRIAKLRATDGGDVQQVGQVKRERVEQITFLHPADLHSLRYRPTGSPEAKWYGRESNLYLEGDQYHADLAPCLGDISYSVNFIQYLHKPAPAEIADGEEFPVDIIIEYEVIG